jgi:DNA-binding response OmpR family regulator
LQDKNTKNRKILVIDDEPDMLHLLERILTEEGYTVRLATDGVYGLSLLTDDKPDLVLLDIMMPGPDGITVLKRIREQTNVPVIMITGKRDMDTIQETIDLGADDYVRKPFRPSELIARIKSKLRRA